MFTHLRFWGLVLLTVCAAGRLPAAEPSHPSQAQVGETPSQVGESEAIAGIKRLGGRFLAKGCKPSWSPDGSRLVFAENAGLKILDVPAGKISDLAAPGEDPAWSPGDGRHIAYVRESGAGKETGKEIWLVDAAGGIPRKLVEGSAPAWLADGKTLCWYSPATSKLQSMSTDIKDAPATDLLHVKFGVSCQYPAVSADGKRIAYRSACQLVVVARDTGETIRTWPMAGIGCYANWSPDGKLLAFGGQGIDEQTGLWILDVEKNQVVRVAGGQYTMPAWSADGSQLACTLRLRTGSEIWTVATKELAALPPLTPAMEHCSVPEAAAELVGPRHHPQGKLVCLDLRQHANRKLAEKLGTTAGNDLKELPQGEQTFAGVNFRIADSAIQLAGTRLSAAPQTVEGIPVHGRMNRLYILHSCQWGGVQFDVRDGTTIGRYEVRYADGSRATVPVVCGEDVRDWWSHTRDKAVTRGQVAWVGRNAAVGKSNLYLRLYLTAWENPHPEKIVASLDYVSTMTAAAPFCVAMTAEEPR